jgi:phenylalanyl-tRNA synthetase beta chain
MKFTLSWLKKHLDTDASLQEITDKLTAIGLELESVDNPAEKYAPFRTATVVNCWQHPNADRLRVCIVDSGTGENTQVVCGAPNARKGMKAVFAPDGSYIPGLGVVLKAGTLRGEASNGMLVSERELELSDEHDGIVDLPEDTEVGVPYADFAGLNDAVIEIGVTPNRGDCLGVRGIARDLAATGIGTLIEHPTVATPGTFASSPVVKIEAPADNCPFFASRLIKGVKNGPSPAWLQQKLTAIGLRPISILVDITNLMTMDHNRPMHVFDAAKVSGDLVVRMGKSGESFMALNDKEYDLNEEMTVIADDNGVVSLSGVMGGLSTGVQDDTVDVLVESALWSPSNIATTGRRLNIFSDARYRFERGVDPEYTVEGLEFATQLITGLCGGEAGEVNLAGTMPDTRREIEFDLNMVKTWGGMDVSRERSIEILDSLGFTSTGDGNKLMVSIPTWRTDIDRHWDLIEEITRIEGLDKIEAISLRNDEALPQEAYSSDQNKLRSARRALAAHGMNEAVCWSFTSSEIAPLFGEVKDEIRLANPISSDLDVMRPSLLPNLILAAQRNADRGYGENALFETGTYFLGVKPDEQPTAIAGVRSGNQSPRHWDRAQRTADAFDAKEDAMVALSALGAPVSNLQTSTDAPGYYHPGRSGSLRLGKGILATFGELHPRTLKTMDVKGPMVAFEVFPAAVPKPKKAGSTARPLLRPSSLQPLERDFAFIVDDSVAADAALRAAKGADKKLITASSLFDVYQGKGIEEGKKSLALSVTIQPQDQALTDEQIDEICQKVIGQVIKATGGELRS